MARTGIDLNARRVLGLAKRVPALLLGALFLFCLAARAAPAGDVSATLAESLFAEGHWQECRVEAARRLALDPADMDAAYLRAAAERRCGLDSTAALRAVHENPATSALTRQRAACELGRAVWQAGNTGAALSLFQEVFDTAQCRDVFLEAACSISLILRDDRRLASEHKGLKAQVRTCREFFTPELWKSCDPRPQRSNRSARPVEWLIRLYQTQVSPALGTRCSLAPSCSAYALQALRRHGLLGLSIYADRAYCEPRLVTRRDRLIESNGVRRIADPLDDHDWWLRGVPP
jgi:putative component of membrane protein insertase Oxa1/YidC/SpoIIIJ protein YidD